MPALPAKLTLRDGDLLLRDWRAEDAPARAEAWARIAGPALVVRGEAGTLPSDVAREMLERLPSARLAELANAGHDVHLDQPEVWSEALRGFLEELA